MNSDSETLELLVDFSTETTCAAGDERQQEPLDHLPVLDDQALATELHRLAQGVWNVLIVANAYTVCVYRRQNEQAQWEPLCRGELDENSVGAAKSFPRGRLAWAKVDSAPWTVDVHTVATVPATVGLLKKWVKDSNGVTGGREGNVTSAIKEELYYLAGWRCQFAGCGRDLRHHAATGRRGRFSYFAHIVAASADGPRGNKDESTDLASDLSNFMLLCDECHRLIDKVNPAGYTVEVLRSMREDSIAEVRRLLDTLQHKSSEVVAIIGNIAGQPAQFSMDDAHEALWGAGLRSNDAKPARYFYPGGQHHDVHSAAYWTSLFQQMKLDLPMLQTLLNGTRAGVSRPRLSVFPMHSTSVLLLAGRVLGDTEGTHLFQPHRNKVGAGTRWAWPATHAMPALDKFRTEVLCSQADGADVATLVVALTSDIDATRLPTDCAQSGELLLPTLRITGPTFDKDCMQQPEDLQLFGLTVDAAMRKLQDEWRVQKVYLFVSAPATAAVVVGQKMQARHHASYVCHEALSGPGSPYKATIELTSTLVRELVSGLAQSHSLQP
ncbi:HNH endonuclease [Caballeronia sp. RCC_10]|uniref:HNH endonuclease n=1 Tax=Caballeronia sp. RCC_10 TaxID=3239227 RepID=UPI0035246423